MVKARTLANFVPSINTIFFCLKPLKGFLRGHGGVLQRPTNLHCKVNRSRNYRDTISWYIFAWFKDKINCEKANREKIELLVTRPAKALAMVTSDQRAENAHHEA